MCEQGDMGRCWGRAAILGSRSLVMKLPLFLVRWSLRLLPFCKFCSYLEISVPSQGLLNLILL